MMNAPTGREIIAELDRINHCGQVTVCWSYSDTVYNMALSLYIHTRILIPPFSFFFFFKYYSFARLALQLSLDGVRRQRAVRDEWPTS